MIVILVTVRRVHPFVFNRTMPLTLLIKILTQNQFSLATAKVTDSII